jgi:hypothetical protein
MNNRSFVMRMKPGVGKGWLLLTAGLTWCAVGMLLSSYALEWFGITERGLLPYTLAAALLVGLVFYAGIFARFSEKNVRRIDAYAEDTICLFAFQRWSSYPLVVLMISMGIFLRKYSAIPKPYLAPLYFGIGSALFIAGLKYFLALRRQN